MPLHIRPAAPSDIHEILPLLLGDANKRQALDACLWAVAPDATERVAGSLRTIEDPITGPIRHLWMVAERAGRIAAVVHGANLPAPPIIDLEDGTAGVLLDDSHLGGDAGVAAALIARTEALLRERGAVLFVAASPAEWIERTGILQTAGYEPTTLYLAKTGLAGNGDASLVRSATAADIDGIVHLSALHRAGLKLANPIFWNIHKEADSRFRQWMITSLSLPDRAMFVSGPENAVNGFIIAQPGSPLHIPAAHDVARVGLIDDFYAAAFETHVTPSDGPSICALLVAAEAVLKAKGYNSAMAICPVKMTEKARLLEDQGFRGGNLWMVKTF